MVEALQAHMPARKASAKRFSLGGLGVVRNCRHPMETSSCRLVLPHGIGAVRFR